MRSDIQEDHGEPSGPSWWRTIRFFIKKNISKHTQAEQKECSCNLCIARNEEFQFILQKPYSVGLDQS